MECQGFYTSLEASLYKQGYVSSVRRHIRSAWHVSHDRVQRTMPHALPLWAANRLNGRSGTAALYDADERR